jgi:hypothetical protein
MFYRQPVMNTLPMVLSKRRSRRDVRSKTTLAEKILAISSVAAVPAHRHDVEAVVGGALQQVTVMDVSQDGMVAPGAWWHAWRQWSLVSADEDQ